jgi:hypothetical protein
MQSRFLNEISFGTEKSLVSEVSEDLSTYKLTNVIFTVVFSVPNLALSNKISRTNKLRNNSGSDYITATWLSPVQEQG